MSQIFEAIDRHGDVFRVSEHALDEYVLSAGIGDRAVYLTAGDVDRLIAAVRPYGTAAVEATRAGRSKVDPVRKAALQCAVMLHDSTVSAPTVLDTALYFEDYLRGAPLPAVPAPA